MDFWHRSINLLCTKFLCGPHGLCWFFRSNRQAINVDKFRCRQLLQQKQDVSLPSSPAKAANLFPVRKSLNFLEEWQAATHIIPPPPPAHPAVVEIAVPETEAPEGFMEAFHGFEEMELNP